MARGRTLGDDGAVLAHKRAAGSSVGGGWGAVSSSDAERAVREKMAAVDLVRQRTAAATVLQSAVRGFLGRRQAGRLRRTLDLRRRVEAFTAALGPATPSPPPVRTRARRKVKRGPSPVRKYIHSMRNSSRSEAAHPRNASQAVRPPPVRAPPLQHHESGSSTAPVAAKPTHEEGPKVSLHTSEFSLGLGKVQQAGTGGASGLAAQPTRGSGGAGERLRDVAKLRQTLNHSRLRSWGQKVERVREQGGGSGEAWGAIAATNSEAGPGLAAPAPAMKRSVPPLRGTLRARGATATAGKGRPSQLADFEGVSAGGLGVRAVLKDQTNRASRVGGSGGNGRSGRGVPRPS